MKILIAEDNAFSRTLLKKTLVKAGYEAVVAENGDAAWEILQKDDPPKLALVDWMMPGLSGVELCRNIRGLDSPIPVYVIFLTAKTDKEDVLEGFAAGADDFIKKPFDSGELLARIQVGRRLVEQQALMHCLIDSIPDPIYVKDNRGLYLGCNKAYAEFVGRESRDIYGSTASDILPDSRAQQWHMEDLRVLANGETNETEGWVENAKGERVYHNTVKIPYLESSAGSSGMIGISRDLTKRIEMEQEMQRLAVAVEQSTESIMITDVEGSILYVNGAFEAISGYTKDEVVGKTPAVLQSGKHEEDFYDKLWATISAGETWEGRFTNRRKNGDIYYMDGVIYPIRASGGDLYYVEISRDITQELAIEKQLRQQQKMNAVGELAGGVSHDFNNILTAILGYVALCLNTVEEDSKTYKYLQEILKAGDRAAKLVRQILTFSRQEEQQFHSLELQPILEDSLSLVETTMKKNIQLVKEIDPSCGAILGDNTQMQQVIVNLCTNAVHAIGKDEPGTLKVTLNQISITEANPVDPAVELPYGPYAHVTVSDTGCGMSSEVQERIFEPYFTTKKAGEGTGFGLSIVHGIVRKHRGAITVHSEEGKGTTFSLYFPLLPSDAEKTALKQELEKTVERGQGRILFVDDDQTILSMGRELLESYGYEVITATNGRRAIETFRQDPSRFDAVVTDYSMPEMNGHELIREVISMRSGIPTILCSGYMEKVEGEDLASLGHTAYLAKPIDWREMSKTIRECLNA